MVDYVFISGLFEGRWRKQDRLIQRVLQIWGFALKEWFDIVFLLCDEDDGSTRVLVNDVIKEVQVSMQQRGYPPVHVQKMDIRPRRNNSLRSQEEIQAEVPFRTSRLRIQG